MSLWFHTQKQLEEEAKLAKYEIDVNSFIDDLYDLLKQQVPEAWYQVMKPIQDFIAKLLEWEKK